MTSNGHFKFYEINFVSFKINNLLLTIQGQEFKFLKTMKESRIWNCNDRMYESSAQQNF